MGQGVFELGRNMATLLDAIRKGRESGEIPQETGEGLAWMMLAMCRVDEEAHDSWTVDHDCGVLRLKAEHCPPHEVPLANVGTADGLIQTAIDFSSQPWATASSLAALIVAAVALKGRQPAP